MTNCNVPLIRYDNASMVKLVSIIVAAAVLVLTAGCGEDSNREPAPVASTTQVRDFGAEIAEESDTIAAILNAGCGDAPKPTCEASGEQLASHGRLLRKLIVESGRSEFYSPALRIIEKIQDAPTSPDLRAAALDLVKWLEEHPT